jgi:catechol 2,3-dioxygenase-like lactoylglutathione lyase family enzyme
VLGVHHSAICTADVERSLRFWRDDLGFTELFDHTFTGDWPELFGAKSDRLRSIFLGDPHMRDCGIIELVELQVPMRRCPQRLHRGHPGTDSSCSPCDAMSTRHCRRWGHWVSPTVFVASPWRPRPERP